MPILYTPKLSYSHKHPILSYRDLNNQQHFVDLSIPQQQQLITSDNAIQAAEDALRQAHKKQSDLLQHWVNQDYAAYEKECQQTAEGQETLDTMNARVTLQNFADILTRSTAPLFSESAPLNPFTHFLSHSLRITDHAYEITGTWKGQLFDHESQLFYSLAKHSIRTQTLNNVARVFNTLLPHATFSHKLRLWTIENGLEGVIQITWIWQRSPNSSLQLSTVVAEWIQAIRHVYKDLIPELMGCPLVF